MKWPQPQPQPQPQPPPVLQPQQHPEPEPEPEPAELEPEPEPELERELAQRYAAEGFVTPVAVLTRAEAAEAMADFSAWAATLPGGQVSGDLRFKPHLHLPFASRIARHPALLRAVRAALGTHDVLLWSSDFNIKAAGDEAFYSAHQDATYTGLEPAEKGLTAVSMPLVRSHPQSLTATMLRGSGWRSPTLWMRSAAVCRFGRPHTCAASCLTTRQLGTQTTS